MEGHKRPDFEFILENTFRTELKLDKEVGGGDLSELYTIAYLIAYPYA